MEEFKSKIYSSYHTVHNKHLYGEQTEADFRGSYQVWKYYYGSFLPDDKEARILEIGCGSGGLLVWLRDIGYKNIQGLDVSPEQVDLARKFGLDVICANLFDFLNAHKNEFDYIIARDVLEHFTRQEIFEIGTLVMETLKPGGQFLIQVPNGEGIFYTSIYFGDFTHEMAFTTRSLSQLFRTIGFTQMAFTGTGPVPKGVISALRYVIWKIVVFCHRIKKAAETGSGKGIFTSNIIALFKK